MSSNGQPRPTHFVAFATSNGNANVALAIPAGIRGPEDVEAIQRHLRTLNGRSDIVVVGWQRFES